MFLTKHVASRTFRLQRLLQPRRCLLLTSRLHTLPAVSRVYTRRALFHHTTLQRKEAPTTLADPAHSDLHYHLIPAPNPLSNSLDAFALTFLPTPPAHSDSRTILGWLPAQSMRSESDSAGLNDFKENASFLKILHEAIKSALVDDLDDIQRNGALQIQQGWMHINDQRNIPALGRIGDPDDIIGTVLVQDSKILPDTYQPMPAYRLCTADGPTQLTPGLSQRLLDLLHAEQRSE